jgi:endonuclease YncB( thermonuclease family)
VTDPRTWNYRVTALLRAVDGDTFDLTVSKTMDFGFRLIEEKSWSTRFRLLGVDTPETNEAGGSAATRFADLWIQGAILDDTLYGATYKTDNFGRWLIDLYRVDTGERLSNALLAAGHAEPYVIR